MNNIPVYDAGVHVFGQPPSGGNNPGEPTLPAAPKGVKATAGNGQVELSWNAVGGVDDYVVKRAILEGGPYTEVGDTTGTAYTDHGVVNGTTYYYVVVARNSVGDSPNSMQVNARPIEGSIPIEGGLKLQYRTNDTNPGDNQFRPHFRIVNTGTTSVALSDVKIRYYYTVDGDKPQQFNCDYAVVGSGNVSGRFVKLDNTAAGADYYLEISFATGAGNLAPGADSGEIQVRINKADWSNYNESDDYSYSGTQTHFADWDNVTLHQGNSLVWGIEP
ncbi:Beta-mannanase/endoglucanase A precursor [compost metagenome]